MDFGSRHSLRIVHSIPRCGKNIHSASAVNVAISYWNGCARGINIRVINDGLLLMALPFLQCAIAGSLGQTKSVPIVPSSCRKGRSIAGIVQSVRTPTKDSSLSGTVRGSAKLTEDVLAV